MIVLGGGLVDAMRKSLRRKSRRTSSHMRLRKRSSVCKSFRQNWRATPSLPAPQNLQSTAS